MSTGISSIFFVLIGLILPLGLLVTGIILILKSKRRGLEYPSCGQCGYDISGSVGEVTRCPECGADFVEGGIVPPGARRQTGMFVLGIVLIAIPLICGGIFLVPALILPLFNTTPAPAQPVGTAPPIEWTEPAPVISPADSPPTPEKPPGSPDTDPNRSRQ